MKPLLFALLLCGCTSTTVFKDGQPVLRTQANARLLTFRHGDIELRIEGLDHAVATRAGGSVVGTAASGAAGIITAAAVGAAVP